MLQLWPTDMYVACVEGGGGGGRQTLMIPAHCSTSLEGSA